MTNQYDMSGSALIRHPEDNFDSLSTRAVGTLPVKPLADNVFRLDTTRYPRVSSLALAYPLREPAVDECAEDDLAPGSAKTEYSPLQKSNHLYDELYDVTALRYFFYDAVEGMFDQEDGCIASVHWSRSYFGLSLFIDWLRERDEKVIRDLGKLGQTLKSTGMSTEKEHIEKEHAQKEYMQKEHTKQVKNKLPDGSITK